MKNYFRITGYCKEQDFSFILDFYGCFTELWQFSSFLVNKDLQVLEVGNATKFLDGNFDRVPENSDKLLLRANADGKPIYTTLTVDGVTYTAVKVANKIYVPDRTKTV